MGAGKSSRGVAFVSSQNRVSASLKKSLVLLRRIVMPRRIYCDHRHKDVLSQCCAVEHTCLYTSLVAFHSSEVY